jgi:hypothetical protein
MYFIKRIMVPYLLKKAVLTIADFYADKKARLAAHTKYCYVDLFVCYPRRIREQCQRRNDHLLLFFCESLR